MNQPQSRTASPVVHRLRQRLVALNYEVASENRYQRRLIADMLHTFGIRGVCEIDRPQDNGPLVSSHAEVIIWEWREPELALLSRICRPRRGWRPAVIIIEPAPSTERVAMIIGAGACSVLARPFSTNAIMSHVAHAVAMRSNEVALD